MADRHMVAVHVVVVPDEELPMTERCDGTFPGQLHLRG